jgi:5-formyltetrahydrofolate cyclo-ligase
MVENKWGIQEPMPITKVLLNQMDVILVPLLCFDTAGHRVGFGKGYYDQYFGNQSYSVNKIGISYFEPISKIEDTNQFDVPLTKCITPWKIYEF